VAREGPLSGLGIFMKTSCFCKLVLCFSVFAAAFMPIAFAANQTVSLTPIGAGTQSGQVVITVGGGGATLVLTASGLTPNTLHSFWLVFDTTKTPFITDAVLGLSVVSDQNLGTLTAVRPNSPVADDRSGFKGGTGIDPNGFVTDANGNATFTAKLNFDPTKTGTTPIVLAGQSESVQVTPVTGTGTCVVTPGSSYPALVDSTYVRQYDTSRNEPAFQIHDGYYRAKLVRGTVASVVVVEHLDGLTHGHIPGVNVVTMSGCGDHVGKLTGAVVVQ
jgi:hypothetical protein